MTVLYDKEMFKKFHALAVTKVEDLEIGKTYYSNTYPEEFVLKRIMTKEDVYIASGLDTNKLSQSDRENLTWILTETQESDFYKDSLIDKNFFHDGTRGYNPWLIFDNKAIMEACREMLDVEVVSDFGEYGEYY